MNQPFQIGQIVNCQLGGDNDPNKQVKNVMIAGSRVFKQPDNPLYLIVTDDNLFGRAQRRLGADNDYDLICTAAVRVGEGRACVPNAAAAVAFLFNGDDFAYV